MSAETLFKIITTSPDPALLLIARLTRIALGNPAFVLDILDGVRSKDPKIAMYCAEAVEKISRSKVALLSGYETEILSHFAVSTRPEIRAPLALVVPRLELNTSLKTSAVTLMFEYLKDDSAILRERVYLALAQVGRGDRQVADQIVPLLQSRLDASDSSERIRAKDLLSKLVT